MKCDCAQIRFHGHNLCSLHESISKEILPAELGGEGPPYQSLQWIQQLVNEGGQLGFDSTATNDGKDSNFPFHRESDSE